MPFLTAPDGVRLAYAQHEPFAGADVVLLAGFRAPGTSWRFQVPALVAAGYRVSVLDLRGHGAADPSPVGTTMATRASDVDVLLRHLGISDAVLVGDSMGARRARRTWRRSESRGCGRRCRWSRRRGS